MYVCSFKCTDIIFDVHDSERVLIRDEYPYYVTPSRMAKIETWLITNDLDKVREREQLDFLISKGWISKYAS